MDNKWKKFYSLWLVFILLFIPLYPKLPLFSLPATYVAIRLEDFIILLTSIFTLIFWLTRNQLPPLLKKLAPPLLLFIFIGFISLFNFTFIYHIGFPHLAFLHWLRRIEYLVPLLAFLTLPLSLEKIDTYFLTILTTTFLVDIYALGQKYLSWPVISTMNREFSKGKLLKLTWLARVNSTFAGHYDLAIFLVITLNLSLGFYLYQQKMTKIKKTLFWFWWLVTFDVLILTASRVSIVAFYLTFPLILISQRRWKLLNILFLISLILTFQSNNLNQRFYSLLPPTIQNKLVLLEVKTNQTKEKLLSFHLDLKKQRKRISLSIKEITPTPSLVPSSPPSSSSPSLVNLQPKIPSSSPQIMPSLPATTSALATSAASISPFPTPEPVAAAAVRSSQIRFQAEWPRAWKAFLKNPLFGTGYSSLGLSTDNDYLRMLGETGLGGILAFFILWLNITFLFVNLLREKTFILTLGYLAALLSLFLSAIFIDAFESSKIAYYIWSLTGLFLNFNYTKERKK